MLKLFLPVCAAGSLMVAALAPQAASAAPMPAGPVAAPESGVETIRHTRRHRAYQRRMMHRPAMDRRYAPSQAGNARNPERPVYQQNQGMTTGGPRY